MNRTSLVLWRPPGRAATPCLYAELTNGPLARPPIYAQLVAEWRAKGRAVPADPAVQWASFADLPACMDGATEDTDDS